MSSRDDTMVPVEELNKLQSDFDALEKEHETLKTEHEALKTEHDELKEKYKDVDLEEIQGVRDRLAAFEKAAKDQVVKDILERAKEKAWDQEELKKMGIDQLKLILKAVDSAKGTASFKGVRSAGAASDRESSFDGKLTVGDLYHASFENPIVKPGGVS